MPQVSAFDTTPAPSTTSRGVVLRNLPAAVVLVAACGLLAATAFNHNADVNDTPRLISAPSAAPVAAPAGDPSVPDASTVFRGREVAVEEPIRTF